MRYPHVVTFQEPTADQQPSGQVTHAYDDVAALSDLPARIVPEQLEDHEERATVETDRYTIVVQGDRAIERTYRVVSTFLDAVLAVVKVQRPVLYRSARTYATIVTAERVAADTAEVSL